MLINYIDNQREPIIAKWTDMTTTGTKYQKGDIAIHKSADGIYRLYQCIKDEVERSYSIDPEYFVPMIALPESEYLTEDNLDGSNGSVVTYGAYLRLLSQSFTNEGLSATIEPTNYKQIYNSDVYKYRMFLFNGLDSSNNAKLSIEGKYFGLEYDPEVMYQLNVKSSIDIPNTVRILFSTTGAVYSAVDTRSMRDGEVVTTYGDWKLTSYDSSRQSEVVEEIAESMNILETLMKKVTSVINNYPFEYSLQPEFEDSGDYKYLKLTDLVNSYKIPATDTYPKSLVIRLNVSGSVTVEGATRELQDSLVIDLGQMLIVNRRMNCMLRSGDHYYAVSDGYLALPKTADVNVYLVNLEY